jgi:hypothetical protein
MTINCWNVEVKGQQHNIEIQLDTILGIFSSGRGRLLVDGEIVRDWGCHPFTMIPKGRLDIEVAGKKSFITAKGGIFNYLVLVLDSQEIPSISVKS